MATSEIVEGLGSADPHRRIAALACLARSTAVTPDELEALSCCLGAREKLVQRRAAETAFALDRAGVDVRPTLVQLLRAPDLRRRWGATFALSLIGVPPPETLRVLIECLGLDDGDIRWAAADLLQRMPLADDRLQSLQNLLVDGNPQQRKMAAYCLRQQSFRSPGVDASLGRALTDPDVAVRLAALAALSRLAVNGAAAARQVAALLDDVDPGVRRAAAIALGDLGEYEPVALTALHRAAQSTDASLCRAAARSLSKLVD